MSYKKISSKHVTEFDHIFRVLFVGDDSVGKTSLLQRYVENTFTDMYMPTIGIDFKISTIKVDKKVIKLQIYDTGGGDPLRRLQSDQGDYFRTIVSAYYPNTDAIVIVYDISDIDSFRHVERWLSDALQSKKDHSPLKDQNIPHLSSSHRLEIPKFLIGNKTDLPSYRRSVTYVAGETLARQHDMIFFETSAKIKGEHQTQSSVLFPRKPTSPRECSVEDIFVEICKECLLFPSHQRRTSNERVKDASPTSLEEGPLLSSFDSTELSRNKTKRYCFCC